MRSDMLLELRLLSSCDGRRVRPVRPPAPPVALPVEEMEALRRRERFVWTSATLVGVCGRARRAAAAAADERDLGGFCFAADMKADAAAVAAFGFAVAGEVGGYG